MSTDRRTANQMLAEKPSLEDDHYVYRMPPMLVALLRLTFGIASVALIAATAANWGEMPWGFRALAGVLALAFGFFAQRSGIWRRTVRFLADGRGVFFPCNELVVAIAGRENRGAWLFVPWSRVSNLRVAIEKDYEGRSKCLAFDVSVSKEEREAFFEHVGYPTDGNRSVGGSLAVAYSDFPPRPEKAVAILRALMNRQRG